MLVHPRTKHDSVVAMGRLHLFGGSKNPTSTEVLKDGRWSEGQRLKAPEHDGCSVAVSPYEVITVHSTGIKDSARKVYKYNVMTGAAKYYKTVRNPYTVSTSPTKLKWLSI